MREITTLCKRLLDFFLSKLATRLMNFHPCQGVLRETLDQDVGGAIAHFFNCLVGSESANPVSEGKSVLSGKSLAKSVSVSVNHSLNSWCIYTCASYRIFGL